MEFKPTAPILESQAFLFIQLLEIEVIGDDHQESQGDHKLARGYLPQTTYSLHYLAHPGLRRAVAHFLEQEREAVDEEARYLAELAPFRKSGGGGEDDSCEA